MGNLKKTTFSTRFIICTVLLIILSILKITPDDVFVKAKKSVILILTEQTDLKKEYEKLKGIFTENDKFETMNPVSDFIKPAENCELVKGFGVQDADVSGFNYGIDIKVSPTQNILSVGSGEVVEIATNQEYGSYIIIKHNDEISTLYANLNEIFPNIKDKVDKGQAIARANTDNNTIHFEIKKGETYLDPSDFIDFGEKND